MKTASIVIYLRDEGDGNIMEEGGNLKQWWGQKEWTGSKMENRRQEIKCKRGWTGDKIKIKKRMDDEKK